MASHTQTICTPWVPLCPPSLTPTLTLLICLLSQSLPFPECHIIEIIEYVTFSDWLLSLSDRHIKFSVSFHSLMAHFFLGLSNIPQSDIAHFTHLPTERRFGCFQVLAIVKKAAVDIHVQVFVWTYVSHPLG